MELWQEMINSTKIEKIFYFSLVVIFGYVASYYYQNLINRPFEIDIAIYSILVACFIFIFIFSTFWWDFPSAILSGILGGVFYTRKVT